MTGPWFEIHGCPLCGERWWTTDGETDPPKHACPKGGGGMPTLVTTAVADKRPARPYPGREAA